MMPLANPVLLIECATTRDIRIDEANGGWTCRPCAPPGDGWQIADASHDHKTKWRRMRLVEAAEATRIAQEGRR